MENRFMVGVRAGQVVIMLPPQGPMSKDDAKNLAAWLMAMAGADEKEAAELVGKVLS